MDYNKMVGNMWKAYHTLGKIILKNIKFNCSKLFYTHFVAILALCVFFLFF